MKDSPSPAAFSSWLLDLQPVLRLSRHRAMIVLAGCRGWGRALAEAGGEAALRVSGDPGLVGAGWVHPGQARRVLGQEFSALVFDAFSGFDPDAFGAVSGTVCGGGVLMLLTPPLDQWLSSGDSLFHQRLVRLIRLEDSVQLVEEGMALPVILPALSPVMAQTLSADFHATQDQRRAVEALCKVALGRRRRPVVVTADRGRGKSAALGMAAVRLLQQGKQRIIFTAPRLTATDAAFAQIHRLLPEADFSRGRVRWQQGCVEFIPPDALCLQTGDCDLVLVDEAAAIPSPLLEKLLRRYARIAFTSTIHGYEGNGRGFAVRFRHKLDQMTPGWKALHMETAVRWAANDPAERFTFSALLLNASAASPDKVSGVVVDQLVFQKVEQHRLVEDEALLAELFGLLVLAHYRTTPKDLLHLLDAEGQSIYAASWNGHIVAAVILSHEGGLSEDLGVAIHAGQRRLQGHLIPQTLAAHAGLPEAVTLSGARVVRLAVHPEVQQRGIGQAVLAQVMREMAAQVDYLGASFGATPELFRFWKKAGYQLVRIGFKRNASSGEHSAVMLKAVNAPGRRQVENAVTRFQQQFVHWLSDELDTLESAWALEVMADWRVPGEVSLSPQDLRDLRAFADTAHSAESCSFAIWKLLVASFPIGDLRELLDAEACQLVVMKVLQKKPWAEVVASTGVTGKAQAVVLLREVVGLLLPRYLAEVRPVME